MTALSLERLVHPRRSAASAPRRAHRARMSSASLIAESVRAAVEIDGVVSPGAQLRVAERFAARIDA
jgi:hypothetical protein